MVNIWKAAAGCDQLHHRFWKPKLSENWGLSLFTHLRENQAFGSVIKQWGSRRVFRGDNRALHPQHLSHMTNTTAYFACMCGCPC